MGVWEYGSVGEAEGLERSALPFADAERATSPTASTLHPPPSALAVGGPAVSTDEGVLADLAVFQALGVAGRAVLTHVEAPQPSRRRETLLPPRHVAWQIDRAAELGVDAVKVGPLPRWSHVGVVAERLARHRFPNVVLSPGPAPASEPLQRKFREPWRRWLAPKVALIVLREEDLDAYSPPSGPVLALLSDSGIEIRAPEREEPLTLPVSRGDAARWATVVTALLALDRSLMDALAAASDILPAILRPAEPPVPQQHGLGATER
jgi:hydroxymethylpyrimidine/phosphomethylpyrimidine kinase